LTQPSTQGLASAWLVVVDMQNVFADPDSQWATPGFAAVLDTNRALIAEFGERVVFTRFVAPRTPVGAWVDYYADWPFALVPQDDPIYDIVAALPSAGHPVVTRTSFGKWDDRPGSLREVTGQAATLVLTGVSTDCCVLSTALAAADAGIAVRVVADACAGLSEFDHQRALDAMSLYAPLITVTSTAAVLDAR
jgi:nicotinamidase-related amidase